MKSANKRRSTTRVAEWRFANRADAKSCTMHMMLPTNYSRLTARDAQQLLQKPNGNSAETRDRKVQYRKSKSYKHDHDLAGNDAKYEKALKRTVIAQPVVGKPAT
jgi:hypothetical protein